MKRSAGGLPVRGEGFSHHHGDDNPREEGHSTDNADGPEDPEQVGQDPGQQRPDGVSTVAPEPVDAHRRGTPVWVGDISDRREQRRVDQGRPQPKQGHRECPPPKPVKQRHQPESYALKQHPTHNHAFAPNAVGERPCQQLRRPPHARIDARQQPDLRERKPSRCKKERKYPPCQPVIQVVHQSGLADPKERPVFPGGEQENLFE